MKQKSIAMFSLLLLLAVGLSLLFPTVALADDSTPPPPEETPVAEVTVEPETHPAVTEVPVTEAATETTAGIATETAVEEPSASEDTAVPSVAEAEPISEVVELLDQTDSVLLDESGNAIPLASQKAAEVLGAADPYIVRGGVTYRFMPPGGCGVLPNCTETTTPIQSAINFAVDGETVFVEAGTFAEQLVINKSLSLVGAGEGVSIIQAPAALTTDPDGTKSLILIDGSSTVAEITGFTISGPVSSSGGCGTSINFGIYVRGGATANIHDNSVEDVRDNPLSGCQNGVAIQVGRAGKSQTGTATIENNQIVGYQKNGITVSGTGSLADIIGNTITGAGPTGITAQNGIQISDGAGATIVDNLVTGNDYTGATWSSTGILLYSAADGVVLDGNTVDGNQINAYVYNSDGVQATDNTFSNATDWEGLLFYASDNAFVDGNLFSGNAETGLYIYNSSNIQVTDNRFLNNGWGYDDPINYYYTGGAYVYSAGAGTIEFHGNSFVGNRVGLWNDSTASVDATGNWWGDDGGPLDDSPVPDGCSLPLDNPSGAGDSVSGCVLYDPWLTTNPFAPASNEDGGGSDRTGTFANLSIPVTGGQPFAIGCESPTTSILIGDVQVVFTALCGYDAVLDLVVSEGLPGGLPEGQSFVDAVTITVLKDGSPIQVLPEGAEILVSYRKPLDGTGTVWEWTGKAWVQKDSVQTDVHIQSQVNAPGTFVLVKE